MLGVDAALSTDSGRVHGFLDYRHHIADTRFGDFAAFAHGFGGMTKLGGRWRGEIGATAGFGLDW